MNDGKLTIDLSGVGNDIPTKLGKSRPTLTCTFWMPNISNPERGNRHLSSMLKQDLSEPSSRNLWIGIQFSLPMYCDNQLEPLPTCLMTLYEFPSRSSSFQVTNDT